MSQTDSEGSSLDNNAGSRAQSSGNRALSSSSSSKVKITRKIPKSNLKAPITFGDRSNIFNAHHYKNITKPKAPKPEAIPEFMQMRTETNYTESIKRLRRIYEKAHGKSNEPSKLALDSSDRVESVENVKSNDAIDEAANFDEAIDETIITSPPTQFRDKEINDKMIISPPTQFS